MLYAHPTPPVGGEAPTWTCTEAMTVPGGQVSVAVVARNAPEVHTFTGWVGEEMG